MDLSPFQASASVVIAAPPDALYDFIADMPRIGEISPECVGGEWESDERGVGATFMGSNTRGERSWKARMRIVVADPPHELAWENLGNSGVPFVDDRPPVARWRYVFTPVEEGTRVDESWQIIGVSPQMGSEEEAVNTLSLRTPQTREMLEVTLGRLKEQFEG